MSTQPSEQDLQAAIDQAVEMVYAAQGEAPDPNAQVVVDGDAVGQYSG